MRYNYVPKLNKRDMPYVIPDEIITLLNGAGEKFLDHDNVRSKSIEVWSLPNRTGKKVTSFTAENPANNEWKTLVKVFAEGTRVYVTYETTGDQVEADDINELQTAVTAIDKDLRDHIASPHADMQANVYDTNFDGIVDRADIANEVEWAGIKNKPANYPPSGHKHPIDDVTGLQAELDAKETPSGAQSKASSAMVSANSYTDSRISALVGAAPAVLDTLNELATALGNDPNFATTIATQLSGKETPAGAQAKIDVHANRVDNPHQVTKEQVGLANVVNAQQATKAEFDEHNNDSVRHITAAERTDWNAKETTIGAQAKVDTHADRTDNPHGVTKAQVGLSSVDNVQQATKTEFNTHNTDNTRHITAVERASWNAKASTAVATKVVDGLLSSADKAKLDGVEVGANNYVHPASHSPQIIAQDANNRFVSDAEKANWNAKASANIATTAASGLMSAADKSKLDGVAANANNYVHPSTHPPSIIAQDTNNRFVTDAEKSTWGAKQSALGFTPENPTNKGKSNGYASLDASGKVPIAQIPNEVVTQDQLGSAGYGDMVKSVYDTDNDGVVDRAKTADGVAWGNVAGKPSTFNPTAHTHTIANVTNLQTELDSKETPAGAQSKVDAHASRTDNPHGTTKAHVGLGSVQNYGIASQANAEAGTSNSVYMTPLRTKQAIDNFAMKKGPVTWNDLSGGGA